MDNFNITVLWFSYIVFAYNTTLLRIISKFVLPMVTRFKNASCGAKMRVKYFSDPSLSRKQGQTVGHYVQYALLHGAGTIIRTGITSLVICATQLAGGLLWKMLK